MRIGSPRTLNRPSVFLTATAHEPRRGEGGGGGEGDERRREARRGAGGSEGRAAERRARAARRCMWRPCDEYTFEVTRCVVLHGSRTETTSEGQRAAGVGVGRFGVWAVRRRCVRFGLFPCVHSAPAERRRSALAALLAGSTARRGSNACALFSGQAS